MRYEDATNKKSSSEKKMTTKTTTTTTRVDASQIYQLFSLGAREEEEDVFRVVMRDACLGSNHCKIFYCCNTSTTGPSGISRYDVKLEVFFMTIMLHPISL